MKEIIGVILGVIFAGMIVLLCLFSCILASKSDELWDKVKKELEKNNERH